MVRTSDDQWQPQLCINLPKRVPDDLLEKLLALNDNEEYPTHLELRARLGADEFSVALLNKMSGQKHWRVSPTGKTSSFCVTGEDASLDISLHIVKGPREFANWTQDNCTAPSDDLPWLYVSPIGAEPINARQLDLIGVGGVSLRATSVYATVPAGFELEETDSVVSVGNVSAGNRTLHLLSDSITLQAPEGDKCSIELGAEDDLLSVYRINGKRAFWGYSNRPVYAGIPQLQHQTEDQTTIVPAHEIFWRPVGRQRSEWHHATNTTPAGDIRIRHLTDNGVRFEARLVVVPKDARIELKTGRQSSGSLTLHNFAATDTAIEPVSGCDITALDNPGYTRFDFTSSTQHAAEAHVQLSWKDKGSATLKVPIPIENSAFIDSNGAVVSFGSSISINELMGLRARVITPGPNAYHMEVELHDAGMSRNVSNACNHRLPLESDRVIHSMALGPMIPKLQRLLALRSTLDNEIRLTLSDNIHSRLTVKRFNTRLLTDWTTGVVQLSESEQTDAAALTMTAISLIEPEIRQSIEFDSTVNGWSVKSLDSQLAPWILVAWQGDLMFSRPAVAPIDAIPSDTSESSTPASMRAVLQPGDYKQRNSGMELCVEDMANNPSHEGWSYFKRCLTEFSEYPPSSFDFTMRLSENPKALALGLFIIRGDQADEYWTLGDKLGFDWHLLTLDAWVNAAVTYHAHMEASLPEDLTHIATEQTRTVLQDISESLPGMDMLLSCIGDLIEGKKTPESMVTAFTQQCEFLLQASSNELLRRQVNNKDWPDEPQLEEWVAHESEIALPEFTTRTSLQTLRDFRQAAVNAPIDAALQLAIDQYPGKDQLSYFIAFREFDSEWFDTAIELVLTWGFHNRNWTTVENG